MRAWPPRTLFAWQQEQRGVHPRCTARLGRFSGIRRGSVSPPTSHLGALPFSARNLPPVFAATDRLSNRAASRFCCGLLLHIRVPIHVASSYSRLLLLGMADSAQSLLLHVISCTRRIRLRGSSSAACSCCSDRAERAPITARTPPRALSTVPPPRCTAPSLL